MQVLYIATAFALFISSASAECANACNGHGRCTSYDMCVCNRNWQANDCSERVCQFGLAHVDTPKGDLDMSGSISSPDVTVAKDSFVYPYGTSEQFPVMRNTDLSPISDSAHYYMECSNKGTCDRTTGTCQCYDGYDGVACQRASCPGNPVCSGHGVCRTIRQLAAEDYGNTYELWDKDSTMGCSCDEGYYGADCSLRSCKYGVDPLYLDDSATIKYSVFNFAVVTTASTIDFTDGTYLGGPAYFAIRFFDASGEDWLTQPIRTGSSCQQVITALEALPNKVIPKGQTYCSVDINVNEPAITFWNTTDYQYSRSPRRRLIDYPLAFWENAVESSYLSLPYHSSSSSKLSGYVYRIKFFGNPGKLRQPEIEVYLDGKRPSISSTGGTVITRVWTDGQQGEFLDYFADHCDGVTVNLGYYAATKYYYLTGFTTAEKALLKTCLADADFNSANNVEVYNWDYGSFYYPHIIKLVKSVTTFTDGGYYAAIYYDKNAPVDDNLAAGLGVFKLLNPFIAPDDYTFNPSRSSINTDNFEVYTTKATLALTSNFSEFTFGFGSQFVFAVNVSYDQFQESTDPSAPFDGDISCEIGLNNGYKQKYVQYCLNKSDNFVLLNFNDPSNNPPHINIYTAERLYTASYTKSVRDQSIFTNFPAVTYKDQKAWDAYSYTLRTGIHGNDVSHFKTHVIVTDLSTNWGHVVTDTPVFHAYKLFPAQSSTYEYVAQCSNRGICDTKEGVCNCFRGYSSDDCSQQNSLSV